MEEYILICEETPEGIFPAIYEAYERKLPLRQTHIQLGEEENLTLFATYFAIETNREKAEKVERTIRQKLGMEVAEAVWYTLASEDKRRGDAVFHTIARGLAGAYRGSLLGYLQDESVALVCKLQKAVWHEVHRFYGFVRFQELESGILYSEIEPKYRALMLLGDHFSNRFPGEHFVIQDLKRKEFLVHPAGGEWFLVSGELWEGRELVYSHKEEEIQKLFRHFVDTIAIRERENPKLQQQLLPLRFRQNMVECTRTQ